MINKKLISKEKGIIKQLIDRNCIFCMFIYDILR